MRARATDASHWDAVQINCHSGATGRARRSDPAAASRADLPDPAGAPPGTSPPRTVRPAPPDPRSAVPGCGRGLPAKTGEAGPHAHVVILLETAETASPGVVSGRRLLPPPAAGASDPSGHGGARKADVRQLVPHRTLHDAPRGFRAAHRALQCSAGFAEDVRARSSSYSFNPCRVHMSTVVRKGSARPSLIRAGALYAPRYLDGTDPGRGKSRDETAAVQAAIDEDLRGTTAQPRPTGSPGQDDLANESGGSRPCADTPAPDKTGVIEFADALGAAIIEPDLLKVSRPPLDFDLERRHLEHFWFKLEDDRSVPPPRTCTSVVLSPQAMCLMRRVCGPSGTPTRRNAPVASEKGGSVQTLDGDDGPFHRLRRARVHDPPDDIRRLLRHGVSAAKRRTAPEGHDRYESAAHTPEKLGATSESAPPRPWGTDCHRKTQHDLPSPPAWGAVSPPKTPLLPSGGRERRSRFCVGLSDSIHPPAR